MLVEIIIPTVAGRERYLRWAIQSCLDPQDKCAVLVSSNGAAASVRDVVKTFSDSRVRLVESTDFLPMALHWEFALEHAKGEVVSIIGDDDAIVPGSIQKVINLFRKFSNVTSITHLPAHYYWPDYPVSHYANKYYLPECDRGTVVLKGLDTLRTVIELKDWYGRLPYLYHGFVRRDVLTRIRACEGRIFKKIAPDIYSDFMLALYTEHYLHIRDCFSVGGQGAKSNGANFLLNTELGQGFLRDLPDDLQPVLSGHSINLQIYEYARLARERAFIGTSLDIAWRSFALRTIVESSRTPAYRKEILDDLAYVLNQEKLSDVARLIFKFAVLMARNPIFSRVLGNVGQLRQKVLISRWPDAMRDIQAVNVYQVARHVAQRAKGGA